VVDIVIRFLLLQTRSKCLYPEYLNHFRFSSTSCFLLKEYPWQMSRINLGAQPGWKANMWHAAHQVFQCGVGDSNLGCNKVNNLECECACTNECSIWKIETRQPRLHCIVPIDGNRFSKTSLKVISNLCSIFLNHIASYWFHLSLKTIVLSLNFANSQCQSSKQSLTTFPFDEDHKSTVLARQTWFQKNQCIYIPSSSLFFTVHLKWDHICEMRCVLLHNSVS